MAREARKERITRKRESQILDAALSVFSEKGFGVATIPDIAEKAGLAVGSIYNYYPSKRDLFIAVIKNFIINAPLLNLIDELPKGDLAVTFTRIMQNRLNLVENKDISKIPFLMAEIQRDSELKTMWIEEFLRPFFKKMEMVYEDLAESGRYTDLKPEIMVRIVGGMILGFLILRMMEGEDSPLYRIPREEITEKLAKFLLFGLSGQEIRENTVRDDDER